MNVAGKCGREGMFENLPVDADGFTAGRKVAIVIQTIGAGPHSMFFSENLVAPALRRLAEDIEKRRQGVAAHEEFTMAIGEEYEGAGDQMVLVRMQALDGWPLTDDGVTDDPISVDEGVDAAVLATLTDEEREAIQG